MMPKKPYPVGYYKVGEAVHYAHNVKEEEQLRGEGFTEGAQSIPKQDYPQMLCNREGDANAGTTT